MFVNVSELASYVICPRLCYFRMRDNPSIGEINAVREIYLSLRKGLDLDWAEKRFEELDGFKEVFEKALLDFKLSRDLEDLKPLDWEVKLSSDRLKLKGILDELVEFNGKVYPLVIALRSPKEDVWFKDRVRISAFCMLLGENGLDCKRGFVHYCYSGELRRIEIGRKERYYVLKLVERVLRLKKGFLPEKPKKAKCDGCVYREVCESKPSTFASKFF